MAVPLPINTINTINTSEQDNGIVLAPVKIAHENGAVETVYIQKSLNGNGKIDLRKVQTQLAITYTLIGIVVMSLTAFLIVRSIKSRQNVPLNNQSNG